MTHKKALLYSLDSSLTLGQLRGDDFCARYTDIEATELEQRMKDRDIQSHIVGENAHYKFGSILRPPYILYSQGERGLLDYSMISIVGPRRMSPYHERVVRDFFAVLQQYHVVMVSGGAPGVDTLVHELSLEYGIPTVMVLGAGFRSYLRSAKRHLLGSIVRAGGLVLSEFRLWEKPAPWTFPQRNRIIAGLSEMVFLPGAAKKSGSLITVDFAHKMNIGVYGVTGSLYDEQNSGSNAYIGQGKIAPVLEFSSCLDQYFTKKEGNKDAKVLDLSPDHQAVYDALVSGEKTIAMLVAVLEKDISFVLSVLMELQLAGVVDERDTGVWGVRGR